MAKRKNVTDDEEEYESSEEEQSLTSKSKSRQKKNAKAKDDSDSEIQTMRPLTAKKPKLFAPDSVRAKDAPKVLTNKDGEKYIDLGKSKRATVRPFKGNVYVDIREYFGTDGEQKPGKKGISLSVEQWDLLKNSIDTIDSFFEDQKRK